MSLVWQNSTDETVTLFAATLRAQGRREATIRWYGYALGNLTDWRADRGGTLDTVTRLEALSFAQYLSETYAPGGVATTLKALRAFYNFLVEEQLITKSPFKGITVRVPDEDQPAVVDEQVEAMLISAKRCRHARRDEAIIVLLCDTGARKGEISALELHDVNLTDGTINIRQSKTKPRIVPLSDRAVRCLGRWMRQRGTRSGPLWGTGNSYALIGDVCGRHSGDTVTPHQFRRRFAIEFLRRGGSESGLMRLCGWKSADLVRLYTRSAATELAHGEFRRLMG